MINALLADKATSDVPTALTSGSLGGQMLLWETATAVAGYLLGINPFDQPDVESAKKAARGLLDAQPEPEAAAFTDGVVEVRATDGLLDGVDTLQGRGRRAAGQARPKRLRRRNGVPGLRARREPDRDPAGAGGQDRTVR